MNEIKSPWVTKWSLIGAFCLGLYVVAYPFTAMAGGGTQEIQWLFVGIKLFGGLSLFLYGMEKMGDALKEVAGEKMKDVLAKLTTNPAMGLLTGLFVTAVIQSSSVTTVMLVGFVQADLMNLSQAIGVILGADIGTTVTAQIVAFKVTKWALLIVTIGFLMIFAGTTEKIRQYGALTMGLGLIFFGMAVMSSAMKPLRTYEPFIDLMQNVDNPVIGILVSALFTGIVQSSSATMGVVVALAMQGLISLEGGIALAFGANIGTCATAGLAAIGKARKAVQVAVAHVTFKVVGVAIAAFLIPQLADLVRTISPTAPADMTNAQDILAFEVPRQVANAHTIFNVVMAACFLPLTQVFRQFVEMMVPIREETAEEVAVAQFKPKYLDENLLYSPAIALSMVRRETNRMGEVVEDMLDQLPDSVFAGNMDKMERLKDRDDNVDVLYASIVRYLARITTGPLSEESAGGAVAGMAAATEIENVGDIIETNMFHLANMCATGGITFDDETRRVLDDYHQKVVTAFKSSVAAYQSERADAAQIVLDMEGDILGGIDQTLATRQKVLLGSADHTPDDMAAFALETDIMENFKRIYQHTQRVARLVTGEEGSRALMKV